MTDYDFGEKVAEYSAKQGQEIPVWVSPKYTQSREKAIEIINKYKDIEASDFWILMNETKTKKMAYTGLIISHNACLKINDAMDEKMKFKPSCMSVDVSGFKNSLVFTYINDEQGIYEVGEVSDSNCKNAYPYAMALKRCFDRVVLKNCKLAYSGVYSDSEADEFKNQPDGDSANSRKATTPLSRDELENKFVALCDAKQRKISDFCNKANVTEVAQISDELLEKWINWLATL